MGAMTVLNYANHEEFNALIMEMINLAFYWAGETLLVTQPASELLFGYEDPFLRKLRAYPFFRDLIPSAVIGLYYGVSS